MTNSHPLLPSGYSDVPPGKIANVETRLEMTARPPARSAGASAASLRVEPWSTPSPAAYRALYRAVGEDWLWTSRILMSDEVLAGKLAHPGTEIFRLLDDEQPIGLLELDFSVSGECEIVYFGLVAGAIGKGAGRLLMNYAVETAWSRPITRLWVHTCTFDHPAAPRFYQGSGFRPYAFKIEVIDDPRLSGAVPRSAAPHVPLIEP